MYIRPKQLWWLVPIFVTLFCIGAVIAKWADKPATSPTPQMAPPVEQNQPKQGRELIAELINQWDTEEKTSFVVSANDLKFSGHFQGSHFELTGSIEDHQIEIKRDSETVLVTVDGEIQNASLLPYSLFTPYDHVMILKGQLQSITPSLMEADEQTKWNRYRFSLPPGEVTSLLSLWLGPQFPTDEVLDQFLKQIQVTYELWYDSNSQQLRQLAVHLQLETARGMKHDQLLFQL